MITFTRSLLPIKNIYVQNMVLVPILIIMIMMAMKFPILMVNDAKKMVINI